MSIQCLLVLSVVAPSVAVAGSADALIQPGRGDEVASVAVRRLAGTTRAGTAAAIAFDGWEVSDQAVLVDGASYAAALIGAHLAARRDLPLLISGEAVPPETDLALRDLGVESVIAVGGVAVPAGVPVMRVGDRSAEDLDEDSVALSVAVVRAVPGPDDGPVVLASAADFPDALAAANVAPARLLLTDPTALPPVVADLLVEQSVTEVTILGGAAAVAPAVDDDLSAMGIAVSRVAGQDRVHTALLAADRAGGPVAVASADRFADAIALVGWAARRQAAVLLTGHDELAVAVAQRLRHIDYNDVVVAGGHAAVGNFVDRQAAAAVGDAPEPGMDGQARPLDAEEEAAMTGVSWHDGCPVALADLRALVVDHWRPDGNVGVGTLVVHEAVAGDLLTALGDLFDDRFVIARMEPVEVFGGDDDASMAANNTSGFNCRVVAGTDRWSEHAYGGAIDINPVQNPYVRGDQVDPPAGAAFLDRSDVRPGMLVDGGAAVGAFDAIGWGWGGRWRSSSDYQHVSQTGR